jgi:hypothetical protein
MLMAEGAAGQAQSPGSPPSGALPTSAPPGRALLVSGPTPVRGLPFFSPNGIPGLSGSYLVGADTVPLWYSREALVFDSAWRDTPALAPAGARAFVLSAEGSPFAERFTVAWKMRKFSVILSLHADEAAGRRFALAFLTRFAFFFDNAVTDAELSFPATVDY